MKPDYKKQVAKALLAVAAELEASSDSVVTVELLCCMTPDGDEEAEQRTEETKQMYDKAARLLRDYSARLDVSEHYDFGEQTAFADAYARIPTSKLIEVLDTFDEHGIVYDNIDLPEGAPQDLVAALNKRYPARSGVMVNASATPDRGFVDDFIQRYLSENGMTVNEARHGGCVEFAEAFLEEHPDAELWETLEMPDSSITGTDYDRDLPLVLTADQVTAELKRHGVDGLFDLGLLGGHAVVKWRGLVFDAGGVSSFEELSSYFDGLDRHHWVRTV
jgi:hypothetical protein